jgi:hypothetical protein
MKNITTLEKVFNRVDELSSKCYDNLVDVKKSRLKTLRR